MRTRIRLIILVLVLSLFLVTKPVAAADVGIAVSGPLVSAEFSVVQGQYISSYLYLTNRGEYPANLTSYAFLSSGPLGSVKVSTPGDFELVSPLGTERADYNFTILSNASGVVVLTIGSIAIHDIGNGSIAYAGIETRVSFLIDPNPIRLKVRVLDQWDWPVEGLEIGLWKERLEYSRQSTNANGTTSYLLSHGLYKLRLYESGIMLQEASLNISSDRLFEFSINRGLESLSTFIQIPLVEIGFGFVLGYICRLVEKRRKRSRPRNEFEEWLEYCRIKI